MERFAVTPESKLRSPQEEVEFLRERIKELENTSIEQGEPHEHVAQGVIKSYAGAQSEQVLDKGHHMLKHEVDAIVLDLAPEEHDEQMAELLAILQERGVKNALAVVDKLDDPHVEDDFHRFLAEYIKAGYRATGIKEKGPLWKALHMTLYEVSLPFADKDGRERPLKEVLSSMEQLYAGLASVASGPDSGDVFTLELAVAGEGEHATVYCAVPAAKSELFEKQLLSVFPRAHIVETKNDYNIFATDGHVAGSVASFERNVAYPIKTYDEFDYDPMNITLSAFAKFAHTGEGAAVQLIVRPAPETYMKRFTKGLEKLRKGESFKDAFTEESVVMDIASGFKDFFSSPKKKDEEDRKKEKEKVIDTRAIESIEAKVAYPILETNIRLAVSADAPARAEVILDNLEATFGQFERASGNKFSFKRVKKGGMKNFVRNFTFRMFAASEALPINLRELATIFHLPAGNVDSSRELKRATTNRAPAPVGLSSEGIVLGVNRYRGVENKIHFAGEDRLRHLYVIGQTGTGKTTLLKNMIIQDIENGDGVCMIDPHGNDIVDVLAAIPEHRMDDVIYFDPSNTERPMALNMLEYDTSKPEQKTFVVNELFSIFQKLYGSVPESMGPMFEQYFRNATMLVIEDPDTGNTLFDVSRVLSDKAYRDLKLSRCNNPIVVQFWRDVAEKAGGEGALANIVPYITSKFDVFLANDIMRPIVTQRHSSFNFRDIMDNKKILLVNLSKGRLGDINANLLGLIIVGKILMAALSRVDSLNAGAPVPFYLYIDEFQNVTTDSIATILSEARKYALSLTIAHQFIKQLEERIKDAVFGNVGSLVAFRVGSDDAEYLARLFEPVFTENDLVNVDNRVAFAKMLNRGKPERAFTLETLAPQPRDESRVARLMQLSAERYGRPRAEVEEDLRKAYGL